MSSPHPSYFPPTPDGYGNEPEKISPALTAPDATSPIPGGILIHTASHPSALVSPDDRKPSSLPTALDLANSPPPIQDDNFLSPGRQAQSPSSVWSGRGIEFALSTSVPQRVDGRGVPLSRRGTNRTVQSNRTNQSQQSQLTLPDPAAVDSLGGFPGPLRILSRVISTALKKQAPKTYETLERTMTIPYIQTMSAKDVPWLNFDLITGPNSDFHTESLSDEQIEEIGGTEYKALRLLSYFVPLVGRFPLAVSLEADLSKYFVISQLIAFIMFGPWISVTHGYDPVFDNQPREVKKPWWVTFIVPRITFNVFAGSRYSRSWQPTQVADYRL